MTGPSNPNIPAAPAIRLAVAADARPIAQMSRSLVEAGLRGWSWNPVRVLGAIQHHDYCVAVAGVNHELAGFAIGEFGDNQLHVSLLAVARAHQRRSIGRALMAWLEQSALTAGIHEIHLELRAGNHGARLFYQSLGFAYLRAVPGYYRGEESAIKMQRKIGSRNNDNEAAQSLEVIEKLFNRIK